MLHDLFSLSLSLSHIPTGTKEVSPPVYMWQKVLSTQVEFGHEEDTQYKL